jgi:hypothetical protein
MSDIISPRFSFFLSGELSVEKMQAYSYRVQARFGSVLNIQVDDNQVSITGPRISPGIYRFWLYSQAVLMIASFLSILGSVIFWNWLWAVIGVVLFIAYFLLGGLGAASFWELEKLIRFSEGKDGSTVTFGFSEMEDVKLGAGWARGSVAWIIFPFVPGIDQMAKDDVVSFLAPDGELPGKSVFALHFRNSDEAKKFLALIKPE